MKSTENRIRTGCAVAAFLTVSIPYSQAAVITLTQISTPFNSPVGIDHHEPTNSVVMSVHYPSGVPYNFERVQADGTHVQFSTASGFTDEVKIATARSGGLFPAGTLFTGNGVDGQIARVSADGSSIINPWVDLPGAGNGLMRGSLHVDRSGAFGGDLLVATTAGEVWRVNGAGVPTLLADVNTHLEGLVSVPNDASTYGPLAGKILAGAEGSGLMYAFDSTGAVTTHSLGVAIEDIDIIPENENFFGVNFGTGRLLGAPASEFDPYEGDILLTQEFGGASGLFRLFWDGAALVVDPFTVGAGSEIPGQWEHVTFSTAGIVEIPPTTAPESAATLALLGIALGGLATVKRMLKA